jgi:hypothetical protein
MTTFDATTTENLIRALRDGNLDVRCRAAEQAGMQRIRGVVPTLVELLYQTGPNSKSLITAIARALGEIGDLRAMQHLGEARYAHSYSGGLPGFTSYTADGSVLEADNQDVLMDEAIDEAEQKLWKQTGAQEYLAQLGRIRMYTFGDFWRSNDIYIDEDIQNQPQYPFTMHCAQRFFGNFKRERFAFEGEIRSIFIRRGKEALPGASFADGGLYPQTLDEIAQLGQSALDAVGEIHFEFGGNATAPYIVVRPEPRWPRPSIVRRCVLDGRTGIRFEEIN